MRIVSLFKEISMTLGSHVPHNSSAWTFIADIVMISLHNGEYWMTMLSEFFRERCIGMYM